MSDQNFVTARRAADLTGLNERTIRRMIARGELPAVKLGPNRFQIAIADLPPRRRTRRVEAQETLDALKRRLDSLDQRLKALETAQIARSAFRDDSDGLGGLSVSTQRPTLYKPPVAPYTATYNAPLASPATTDRIARVSDACTFLARHGISYYTPKTWPWLKTALADGAMSPADLLDRVQTHINGVGHRAKGMSLHKCTQADCPCSWAL